PIIYIYTLSIQQTITSISQIYLYDSLPISLCFSIILPATVEIYALSLHDALPIFVANLKRFAAGGPTAVVSTINGDSNETTAVGDRKSTRLNSSHVKISYAVFCMKKKRDRKRKQLKYGDRVRS